MNNKSIKILYIDNEIETKDNIASILKNEGFQVIQAKDRDQGMKIFSEEHPDIVISDIKLLNSNGYELLSSIRESGSNIGSCTPFIFLSSTNQKANILKGIDMMANDYLIKPVDSDILIAKIREKISNFKMIRKTQERNITILKSQVANIVPREMLQYVDLINRVSSALRSEIYGPLPHKKYLEDLGKIYIHSLRLKTTITNFLDGTLISNQLGTRDELVKPVQFLQGIVDSLNKGVQTRVVLDTLFPRSILPNMRIDKKIISDVIKRISNCMLETDKNLEINISIYSDPLNRLAVIFYSKMSVDKQELKNRIDKSVTDSLLNRQGLMIESMPSESTRVILFIPSYRAVNRQMP